MSFGRGVGLAHLVVQLGHRGGGGGFLDRGVATEGWDPHGVRGGGWWWVEQPPRWPPAGVFGHRGGCDSGSLGVSRFKSDLNIT